MIARKVSLLVKMSIQLQCNLKSAVKQLRQIGAAAAASELMIRQVVTAALWSPPVLGACNVTDVLSVLMLLVVLLARFARL